MAPAVSKAAKAAAGSPIQHKAKAKAPVPKPALPPAKAPVPQPTLPPAKAKAAPIQIDPDVPPAPKAKPKSKAAAAKAAESKAAAPKAAESKAATPKAAAPRAAAAKAAQPQAAEPKDEDAAKEYKAEHERLRRALSKDTEVNAEYQQLSLVQKAAFKQQWATTGNFNHSVTSRERKAVQEQINRQASEEYTAKEILTKFGKKEGQKHLDYCVQNGLFRAEPSGITWCPPGYLCFFQMHASCGRAPHVFGLPNSRLLVFFQTRASCSRAAPHGCFCCLPPGYLLFFQI